jgi:hypothetical protein
MSALRHTLRLCIRRGGHDWAEERRRKRKANDPSADIFAVFVCAG